jgi:hypothetical protein
VQHSAVLGAGCWVRVGDSGRARDGLGSAMVVQQRQRAGLGWLAGLSARWAEVGGAWNDEGTIVS